VKHTTCDLETRRLCRRAHGPPEISIRGATANKPAHVDVDLPKGKADRGDGGLGVGQVEAW